MAITHQNPDLTGHEPTPEPEATQQIHEHPPTEAEIIAGKLITQPGLEELAVKVLDAGGTEATQTTIAEEPTPFWTKGKKISVAAGAGVLLLVSLVAGGIAKLSASGSEIPGESSDPSVSGPAEPGETAKPKPRTEQAPPTEDLARLDAYTSIEEYRMESLENKATYNAWLIENAGLADKIPVNIDKPNADMNNVATYIKWAATDALPAIFGNGTDAEILRAQKFLEGLFAANSGQFPPEEAMQVSVTTWFDPLSYTAKIAEIYDAAMAAGYLPTVNLEGLSLIRSLNPGFPSNSRPGLSELHFSTDGFEGTPTLAIAVYTQTVSLEGEIIYVPVVIGFQPVDPAPGASYVDPPSIENFFVG